MRTKPPPSPGPVSLGGIAAVCCLAGWLSGCSGSNGSGNILADMIEPLVPPKPSQVAREAFNVYDADLRRRSVALLSSSAFGHEEPYVRMYRLLIDDLDPTVRAACAHALGIHGTTQDAPTLIALLNDDTGFVRWEAAKALQKIHHKDAVLPLINTMADDEDADVRMAAAAALGQYPTRPVFNALVGALSDHNFGVVQTAAVSLSILTGQDLGTDGGPWLDFAAEYPADLFTGRRPYTYMPYQKPPGKLKKIKFWNRPKLVRPQAPVGMHPSGPADTGT
jgi:HEAT repeat protein